MQSGARNNHSLEQLSTQGEVDAHPMSANPKPGRSKRSGSGSGSGSGGAVAVAVVVAIVAVSELPPYHASAPPSSCQDIDITAPSLQVKLHRESH